MSTGGKLTGIQVGRGVAAMLVVLCHGGRMMSLDQYAGEIPLGGLFNFGHAGVDFFFVLSGFIIYYVHAGDIDRTDRLRTYAWRRVTRIYPVYWVITGIALLINLFRPAGPRAVESEHLFYSLVLWHHDQEPIVGVAWSLEHEMLFYALFAVLIINRRLGQIALAGWAAVVVACLFVPRDQSFLAFVGSPFHVQFFIGMAVAHLARGRGAPYPRTTAAVGAALFLAVGIAENLGWIAWTGVVSKCLFGLTAGATVLGLAVAERRGLLGFGRFGTFLGDISYSLYLVHILAIGMTLQVLARTGLVKLLPGPVTLLLLASAATIAASLVFVCFERPVMSWVNARRKPSSAIKRVASGSSP